VKSILIQEKFMLWLAFNPGLALTGFQTLQQVNLTQTHNPIEYQHLVSGQL